MTTVALNLTDPGTTFVPSTTGGDGPLIDELRDKCGFTIQGIDWVCRQFGFDLIAAIFDPIAGDYDAVDRMATNWGVLGNGLGQIGGNYESITAAVPTVWSGLASDAAAARMSEFGQAFSDQAEGTQLISAAMQDMLVATKAVMEIVAEALSLVDEVVLKVAASFFGWAKEIATGGASVRKVISLVNRAIDAIRTLENIIPPLLQACATLSVMMKAMRVTFQIGSVAANSSNGMRADDIGDAAY